MMPWENFFLNFKLFWICDCYIRSSGLSNYYLIQSSSSLITKKNLLGFFLELFVKHKHWNHEEWFYYWVWKFLKDKIKIFLPLRSVLQLQLLCKIRSNTHIHTLLFSHFFIWGENNWRGIQMLKLWGKCALNFIIELIFKRSSLFWDSNLKQIVWISKTPTEFSVQDENCIMIIFINPGIFIKKIVTYPMNVATKVSNLFSNSLIDLIINVYNSLTFIQFNLSYWQLFV